MSDYLSFQQSEEMERKPRQLAKSIDVSKLPKQTLTFKPSPREKPAFNSPLKDNRGRN